MTIFLAEVARRHKHEYILMIYDGAPCHSEMALSIPANMMTETLPAHCPELNPTEHIWDEVREKFFPNLVFDSMAPDFDSSADIGQCSEEDESRTIKRLP
jgi:hypothetical protein